MFLQPFVLALSSRMCNHICDQECETISGTTVLGTYSLVLLRNADHGSNLDTSKIQQENPETMKIVILVIPFVSENVNVLMMY